MQKIAAFLLLALSMAASARAQPLALENHALRVEINPETGLIRVREKQSGQVWTQSIAAPSVTRAELRRAAGPGRDGEPIRLSADMLGDATQVNGDRDCSARVWLSYDAANLYLAADVADDALRFAEAGVNPWERDSIEVWLGAQQIVLSLAPGGSVAYLRGSQRLSGGSITVKPRAGGYQVDAALPWAWSEGARAPKSGETLRLAVGINDADRDAREGQIYWPRGWVHSQPASFAIATVDAPGNTPAAAAPRQDVYRLLQRGARTLELERRFDNSAGGPLPLRLRFSLPDDNSADLLVEAQAETPQTPLGEIRFLEPFILDAPHGVLAVADYGDGHLYPLDLQPFPRGSFSGDRLDMPWVGLCDLDSGRGYMLLLETSDDAAVTMQRLTGKNGRALMAPVVSWRGQQGVFGAPRRLRYHFASQGGYVALCRAYRDYARKQGLVAPFTEKLKKNPNLTRLFGAPDVWGDASLAFARAARAAGVEKMLIHGRPATPADMRAIRDLGYLPSEYDNYTDIFQTENGQIRSDRGQLPQDAVQMRNGERMKAWLTWDKKQYMKRCPALWPGAATQVADRVLKEWPFVGRFIDVTSAEGLYECYDPAHPLTRGEKRACGPKLYKVFRDRGLVMGGEHGIWWAVPWLDYIEGMQSGGYTSWPAGYLLHPKTKDEEFTYPSGGKTGKWADYEKWGIGHQWRAPLWELVFHDCIVSTWYWGDSSDFLLDAAPEVTPKKDAFNILYGTMPMMWANNEGSWRKNRAVFLSTYRNVCKLHEVVATAAMLSHEFLTADHAAQRTRFSDGTVCVVNFGEKPYRATLGKRSYLLPQNGWAVQGPKISQSRALEGGTVVTAIRASGYFFTDRGGAPLTLREEAAGRLRIVADQPATQFSIEPTAVAKDWKAAGSLLYAADAQGNLLDAIPFQATRGKLRFAPRADAAFYLLLWGKQSQRPDLRVSSLTLSAKSLRQGEPLRVTAKLANAGNAAAPRAAVDFLLDGARVARVTAPLNGRGSRVVSAVLNTKQLDGDCRLTARAVLPGATAEIAVANNQAEQQVEIRPNWALWTHRRYLNVAAGDLTRDREPVSVACALPADADPASVRVATLDAAGNPAAALPAQRDGEELCFILPGKLAAGTSIRLALLWRDGKSGARPPIASFWRAEQKAIVAPGYEARFTGGALTFLAPRSGGKTGKNFLKNLILSSAVTGWTEEPGTVQQFEVEAAGPARTILQVRKALNDGIVYEKRYTFYPRRFEVETRVNKPAGGLYSRAQYLEPAAFCDDKGHTAVMDGKGDGENVSGRNIKPRWYAVYAPEWAHCGVALTPFNNIDYWDTPGNLGSIGFNTGNLATRVSYGIRPGAADGSFAEEEYRQLTAPVAVTWEQ